MVFEYSVLNPAVLDKGEREELANQILGLLKAYLKGKEMKKLRVLDLGCSAGIITAKLADSFGLVYGIDIDKKAIKLAKNTYKKKNLNFLIMDGTRLNFPEAFFDLCVCNQVYYFLPNQERLVSEIYRVLKPGGICFFTGGNKYSFLKNHEPCKTYYLSYWQLNKLLKHFLIHKLTARVIQRRSRFFGMVPIFIWEKLEFILPNFIWVLEKK